MIASCMFLDTFKVKCPVTGDERESSNVLLRWLLYISQLFGNKMFSKFALKG